MKDAQKDLSKTAAYRALLADAVACLLQPLRKSVSPVSMIDPRSADFNQVCHHRGEVRFLLKCRQSEEWRGTLLPILDDLDRLIESSGEADRWEEEAPAIANRLEAFTGPVGESSGNWLVTDTPTRWGIAFDCSAKTFVRRVNAGTIRAIKHSDRAYQVHSDSL